MLAPSSACCCCARALALSWTVCKPRLVKSPTSSGECERSVELGVSGSFVEEVRDPGRLPLLRSRAIDSRSRSLAFLRAAAELSCPMTGRQNALIKSSVGAAFYPCCALCQTLGSEGSVVGSVGSRRESGMLFSQANTLDTGGRIQRGGRSGSDRGRGDCDVKGEPP